MKLMCCDSKQSTASDNICGLRRQSWGEKILGLVLIKHHCQPASAGRARLVAEIANADGVIYWAVWAVNGRFNLDLGFPQCFDLDWFAETQAQCLQSE